MFSSKEFEIDQLRIHHILDRYQLDEIRMYTDERCGGLLIDMAKSFAVGDRVTANYKESRHVEDRVWIPVTSWNWVKKIITDWQPTLKFGWLVPTLRAVDTEVTVKVKEKIYNVYPKAYPEGRRCDRVFFAEMHPTPMQWLSAEPPTGEQIRQAEIEVLDAIHAARAMAYNRVFENEGT